MHTEATNPLWSEQRDGYTHSPSGTRVIPCGSATYAVVKEGRQVRNVSGRLRRWLILDKAKAYVEQADRVAATTQ